MDDVDPSALYCNTSMSLKAALTPLLFPKADGLHGFLKGVASSPHCHNLFPQAAKQGIRDSWATWNPQRRAAHELQQLVQSGQVTVQDTISAQRQAGAYAQHEPLAGSIPPADAEAWGWYGHPKPFAWPAPRDSQVRFASLCSAFWSSLSHCMCRDLRC